MKQVLSTNDVSKLKVLNLADNNFGNGLFGKLVDLPLHNLEELKLSNTGITNIIGFKQFSSTPTFKNLKKLNLYRNEMGIEILAVLKVAEYKDSLKYINLNNTSLPENEF